MTDAAELSALLGRAVATGVGSMPGTDPMEAALLVAGELPDLPALPELPARGPGSDLLGRGAAFLVDLAVDLQPAGWRLVPRPSPDGRRARGILDADLDALAFALSGRAGPLKIAAAGPWTLAAGLELTRGDKALRDPGAVADIAASLGQGLADTVADLSRRLPGSTVLVQLDEPGLPAVLGGRLPSASGFGSLPTPEPHVAQAHLGEVVGAVVAAGGVPVVHCCAPRPPVGLAVAAGARAVSVDATLLTPYDDEALGGAVEAGVRLLLGLVPSTDPASRQRASELARPALGLWRRLGFAPERLGETVVVTPTCGLAGASPEWARRALVLARDTARELGEAT